MKQGFLILSRGLLFSVLALVALCLCPIWVVADTSIANITVVGHVPSFFSVTSIGQQVDLDLSPNVTVSNRTIGILAFKYNENIQSLNVASDTVSGAPEDSGGNPYQFGGTGDFFVGILAGCDTVDPTYNTPFVLTNVGVDIKSALSSALVLTGIQEECEVTASYSGTNTVLPLAGRFEMKIVVTMTSF